MATAMYGAAAAIERLAAVPTDPGFVLNEIPLPRMRALLARAHGGETCAPGSGEADGALDQVFLSAPVLSPPGTTRTCDLGISRRRLSVVASSCHEMLRRKGFPDSNLLNDCRELSLLSDI